MKNIISVLLLCFLTGYPAYAAEWSEFSQSLYEKAKAESKFPAPADMPPRAVPMQNGKGFFLIWTNADSTPQKWIVSMPGRHGLITDEYALWAPSLKGRDIGLVEVQWWLGTGDTVKDYLTPFDIYRELDHLLPQLGIKEGQAMLHGFSRGSANIYPVAALDRTKGHKFFSVFVANSGGASLDYPPTQDVDSGVYGDKPFAGTQWVTVCGYKDQEPNRDGCPGMKRTGEWLEKMGATIALRIEDPSAGHGALHTNPRNTKNLLDWFLE